MRDAYASRYWRKLRLAILDRDHHLCQVRLPVCTTIATHVDHITPLAEGGAPYDPTNLRASCGPCNSSLAGQYIANKYGPYQPGRHKRRLRTSRRTANPHSQAW